MIGKFNKVRDPAILTFYFLSQTTPTWQKKTFLIKTSSSTCST
jgi:hypothetical protein